MNDLRGLFGGIVEDNRDPQKLGRLKVRVPHVYGVLGSVFGVVSTNDLPWALPMGLPSGLTAQSGGADWLPEIGDLVAVNFLDNEPEKPVWSWFMQTQKAAGSFQLYDYATSSTGSVTGLKRGAWTRYGHTVEWNSTGLILTTSKGYHLLLTDASSAGNDGDITLATQAGQSLEFDDSTGDATLNVNHDWNINVATQILAFADSFSLTTSSHEIELISGSALTLDTKTDLDATVGQNLNLKVSGQSTFDLTGSLTINDAQSIAMATKTNLTLSAVGNVSISATNTLSLASTGSFSLSSAEAMALTFTALTLGSGAASPFVLGDQLLAYLDALYTALLTHTHAGVFPGSSSTSVMIPSPPQPSGVILSAVITGK